MSRRPTSEGLTRRHMLGRSAAVLAGLATGGGVLSVPRRARGATTDVTFQLGWIMSNGQIGEVVARSLGYFEAEQINLKITPGGPNVDGVAIVASGSAQAGNLSSSPSLMLARAGGLPVKCFAVGYQEHPFTYFSLPKKPIRSPHDMIGKKIGTQGTARILLRALLVKHKIKESDVQVVVMGSDMMPLMTGQVDAVSGWLTNVSALRPLGPERIDLRLWDAGIQLYANLYYATDETLQKHPDVLARFTRAAARGWQYTHQNPEKAVDLLVKAYPNLDRDAELDAIKPVLGFSFTKTTAAKGWGTMEPGVWEQQLRVYDELQQFKGPAPKVTDVMTESVLQTTAAARPKIGA
ncbi:MAG: nitrate ABC transporter substrate-binding protein [Candidatus Rokuibacteriota bacterium]|nr:MAG: nitrate ABC transporter substrate-binding protein [Candidatus Rokubacteria bacterium]